MIHITLPHGVQHLVRIFYHFHTHTRYKSVELPGGAKAGEDFEGVEGTLTFKDGETTKDINIKVMDDEAVEDDEAFQVLQLHLWERVFFGTELQLPGESRTRYS